MYRHLPLFQMAVAACPPPNNENGGFQKYSVYRIIVLIYQRYMGELKFYQNSLKGGPHHRIITIQELIHCIIVQPFRAQGGD